MPIEENVIGKRSMRLDYVSYLDMMKPKFVALLKGRRRVKVSVTYVITMYRNDEERNFYFKSKAMPLLDNAMVIFDRFKHKLFEEIETHVNRGSGWNYSSSVEFTVSLVSYSPFAGGTFTELPREIKSKKAVINLDNDDDQCFKWCITRHFNPVGTHANRVTKLLKEQSCKFDWSNCTFPMELGDIYNLKRTMT